MFLSTKAVMSLRPVCSEHFKCSNYLITRANQHFNALNCCSLCFQSEPIRVLVTGAAGQIAYSLLYSIAKGDVFGKDQVVNGFFFFITSGSVTAHVQDSDSRQL